MSTAHGDRRRRRLDARASAPRAAPRDAPHPPLRGEGGRALQPGQDPRLPPPLHRRGGRRGRGDAGARRRTTRSSRPTASTATRSPAACRPASLMAEMFGKANGCSRGRGGSMHFFDAARRFYGGYAIVGGGLPIAVGLALADKLAGPRRASPPASSATAPSPRASSTSRSTSPRSGGCRCSSSARTTSTRWARPSSARQAQLDMSAQGAGLRRAGGARGRDGRPRRRATPRGAARSGPRAARARACSSSAPTASAPTRWPTPTSTARRTRSSSWKERDPIALFAARAARERPARRTPTSPSSRPTVAAEIDAAVADRRGGRRGSRSRTC